MRYPKIIDELNDSVSSIVQLVLTVYNSVNFVKSYVRMNAYYIKDSVERYRQQEEFVDAGRRNLKRWNMWRNILYAGITFLVFLGFLFVGAATDPNPAHLQHI